jgi:pimeloyl-ACP methyl ester carboxylesterase
VRSKQYLFIAAIAVALSLVGYAPAVIGGAHGAATGDQPAPVPTLTLGELRAKYELPNSRYINVDGVDLHYVDEGAGPVVVFLHASYNGLQSWEGVTSRLKDRFRTVRFDFPNYGLSGSETKATPPEKFHLIERNYEIMVGFVDALGLERFAVVGTSSGGSVAFRYAARHTDRVERLILINSAGMPRTPRTDPLRSRIKFAKYDAMPVKPRDFWELASTENFIPPNTAPDWWLDQVFDFNRREGALEEQKRYRFNTGDPETLFGQIQAPTLIMWGKDNPVVMHLEANVMQLWMTGAPSIIRKYPGLGHYPYVEDIDAVYPDIDAFLKGELDDELRRTARLKPGADCDCESD